MSGAAVSRRVLLGMALAATGSSLLPGCSEGSGSSVSWFDLPTSSLARDLAIRKAVASLREAAPAVSDAFTSNFFAPQAAGEMVMEGADLNLLGEARSEMGGLFSNPERAKVALQIFLGKSLHRLADRVLRERLPASEAIGISGEEARLICDGAVIRAFVGSLADEEKLRRLLNIAHTRMEVAVHTFRPGGDILEWSRALVAWRQAEAERLNRLAAMLSAPPTAAWTSMITETKFIARQDVREDFALVQNVGNGSSVITQAAAGARELLLSIQAYLDGAIDLADVRV